MPRSSRVQSVISKLLGRPSDAEKWDAQYAEGRWDGFARLDELAHYSVIAGYVLHLKPKGAVLDLGCGDGTLRDRLHPAAFSRYVGVDFSEAIARAQSRADDRTSFIVGDMRTFTPDSPFDVIVFNESLYYVPEPIAEIERFSSQLAPDGIFVISTHLKPRSEELWRKIESVGDVIDHTVVTNVGGVSWKIGVVVPKN